ncbi:hypothetical protein [Rhodocyclus purpureus]|uniref:hypothetical protein n=1 Tax=Rhodocyclus purpureus TaxID=1067 RepID=UPI001912CC7D|nr:hypothetical protein [Rhodocyclus purpureus]
MRKADLRHVEWKTRRLPAMVLHLLPRHVDGHCQSQRNSIYFPLGITIPAGHAN